MTKILNRVVGVSGSKYDTLKKLNWHLVLTPALRSVGDDFAHNVAMAVKTFSVFALREYEPIPETHRLYLSGAFNEDRMKAITVTDIVEYAANEFVRTAMLRSFSNSYKKTALQHEVEDFVRGKLAADTRDAYDAYAKQYDTRTVLFLSGVNVNPSDLKVASDTAEAAKDAALQAEPAIKELFTFAKAFCVGREIEDGKLQRWNTIHDAYQDVLLRNPAANRAFMSLHDKDKRAADAQKANKWR